MLCPYHRRPLLHRRQTDLPSRNRRRYPDLRSLWSQHPAVLQRQRLQHRPDLFGRHRRRHLRVAMA
jgi:hypothetical protein